MTDASVQDGSDWEVELTNADGQAIDLNSPGKRKFLRDTNDTERNWVVDVIDRRLARLIASTSLLFGDLVALMVAYGLMAQVAASVTERPLLHRVFVLLGLISLISFWAASLYPGYRLHHHQHMRRRLMITLGIGAVACLSSVYIFDDWEAASLIAAFLTLAQIVQPILQTAVRLMVRRIGCWGDAVSLITAPELDPILRDYFQKNWRYGINPVPVHVDYDASSAGINLVRPNLVRPNGKIRKSRIALVTTDRVPHLNDLAALRREFREVILLADIPHLKTSGLRTADVKGCIGLRLDDTEPRTAHEPLRRVMDIMIAVPAAIFFAPIMLIAAAAIWLVDPGPVIYRQAREGRGGRTVHVLKLRTMYRDAEQRLEALLLKDEDASGEWSAHFKLKNDPRILPVVGRILRRSSCDELPQLFNVIAGDMSIVGPRPFPEYHLAAMPSDFRRKRSSVTPGLTGLWQISDRSNAKIDLQMQLDEFYIDNRSMWLDLYILFSTVYAVFKRNGAY